MSLVFSGIQRLCIALDGRFLQVLRNDIVEVIAMANGADNLLFQQRNPEHQQSIPNELFARACGIGFRLKNQNWARKCKSIDSPSGASTDRRDPPSINMHFESGNRVYNRNGVRRFEWEQKDEYEVYRDEDRYTWGGDVSIINISKNDIRVILERASLHEKSFICLPEHWGIFTQATPQDPYSRAYMDNKLHGIYRFHEDSLNDFKWRLDSIYHPLNDSISWLTTCMEQMRHNIANM